MVRMLTEPFCRRMAQLLQKVQWMISLVSDVCCSQITCFYSKICDFRCAQVTTFCTWQKPARAQVNRFHTLIRFLAYHAGSATGTRHKFLLLDLLYIISNGLQLSFRFLGSSLQLGSTTDTCAEKQNSRQYTHPILVSELILKFGSGSLNFTKRTARSCFSFLRNTCKMVNTWFA